MVRGLNAGVVRSVYSTGKFEIGDILAPPEEPNTIITSESKRVRVWDLRRSVERGAVQTIENPDAETLPSKAFKLSYTSGGLVQHGVVSKAYKMRYQNEYHRLVAHF